MTAILFKVLSQGISHDVTEILTAGWLVTVWAKVAVWDCYNVAPVENAQISDRQKIGT